MFGSEASAFNELHFRLIIINQGKHVCSKHVCWARAAPPHTDELMVHDELCMCTPRSAPCPLPAHACIRRYICARILSCICDPLSSHCEPNACASQVERRTEALQFRELRYEYFMYTSAKKEGGEQAMQLKSNDAAPVSEA